jgi:hypothetical protein
MNDFWLVKIAWEADVLKYEIGRGHETAAYWQARYLVRLANRILGRNE